MKVRRFLVAAAIATLGLFPFAGHAQATHNCGFEPCPHPDDVIELLCYKFAIFHKLGICELF